MPEQPRPPAGADLRARLAERIGDNGALTPPTDSGTGIAPANPFAAIAQDALAQTSSTEMPVAGATAPAQPPATAPADIPTASSQGPAQAAAAAATTAAPPAAAPTPADVVEGTGAAAPAAAAPAAQTITPPAAAATTDTTTTTAPAAAAATTAAPSAATPPQGEPAPAAAAAASTVPDGYEEISVEEAPGAVFKFLAPKGGAQYIKDGYMRRADYTRKTQALARHRDILQPMIESGDFDVVRPLLETALTNPAFGNRVAELFRRMQSGLPVYFADEVAPQIQQPPAGAPAAAVAPGQPDPLADDPWAAPIIERIAPMEQTLTQVNAALAEMRQRDQQVQQQQQHVAQIRQRGAQIRTIMTTQFPGEYDGPQGEQHLAELFTYARDQGYMAAAQSDIGGMMLARQAIAQARAAAAAAAPGPVPSTAAATIASVQAEAEARARQAAGHVAATTAPPSGTGAPAPVAGQVQKPAMRNADGAKRTTKSILAEALSNATATR